MKIDAYGLTGFGNVLLEELLSLDKITISKFFTRSEQKSFPHYKCENLEVQLQKFNIPYECVSTNNWKHGGGDIAIVSSFHKIFTPKVLKYYKMVINIHPSYLPYYKGATPTNQVILNNEESTGISAHIMTPEIDSGVVIFRKKLLLSNNENDGSLRLKLGELSREVIQFILKNYPAFTPIKTNEQSSFYKRFTVEDTFINKHMKLNQVNNILRAFSPYPGAILIENKKQFRINKSGNIEKEFEFLDGTLVLKGNYVK